MASIISNCFLRRFFGIKRRVVLRQNSFFFFYFFRLHICFLDLFSCFFFQVKTIRDGLRKVGLGAVDVETIENVQGWVEAAFS